MASVSSFQSSQAKKFLESYHQHKIFDTLTLLASKEQTILLEQLAHLAQHLSPTFSLPTQQPPSSQQISPFTHPIQDTFEHHALGEQALQKGAVMGILLAGGDGSRLGFDQPKGCFPVSPIMRKSLFQLHCEKILALQKQLSCSLPLTILTSQTNHAATIAYFERHHFFGLKPSKVLFLIQSVLPVYNLQHQWVFKSATHLSTAPSGNGSLLAALRSQWQQMSSYSYFTVTNIDNALATLYDIPLISAHLHHTADVSLRCFKHNPVHDNVGFLASSAHRLCIIDYTAVTDRTPFSYGNINTLCFSQPFIQELSQQDTLPIHWVEKKDISYDHHTHSLSTIPVFKGERFLSDTIVQADNALALNSLAEDHFAPLKNLQGINDVASVQQALLHKDQKIFKHLTGLSGGPALELSMEFHYPDETLRQKCLRIKKWPSQSYLSPEML